MAKIEKLSKPFDPISELYSASRVQIFALQTIGFLPISHDSKTNLIYFSLKRPPVYLFLFYGICSIFFKITNTITGDYNRALAHMGETERLSWNLLMIANFAGTWIMCCLNIFRRGQIIGFWTRLNDLSISIFHINVEDYRVILKGVQRFGRISNLLITVIIVFFLFNGILPHFVHIMSISTGPKWLFPIYLMGTVLLGLLSLVHIFFTVFLVHCLWLIWSGFEILRKQSGKISWSTFSQNFATLESLAESFGSVFDYQIIIHVLSILIDILHYTFFLIAYGFKPMTISSNLPHLLANVIGLFIFCHSGTFITISVINWLGRIQTQPVKITAGHYFYIQRPLLSSIFAGLTTYLVVMLQLRSGVK